MLIKAWLHFHYQKSYHEKNSKKKHTEGNPLARQFSASDFIFQSFAIPESGITDSPKHSAKNSDSKNDVNHGANKVY
ncbi:MAG TPA: hypothetical protein DCQ93_05665 [Bacteroidetes bacterium]|nr:hypothetical protein [Bacteroidota bacterium]